MNITCTVEVTPQQIADQMVTAIESRIGCWLGKVTLMGSAFRDTKESIWYADPMVFTGQFAASVTFDRPDSDDDGDHNGNSVIGYADVQRGLEVMAREYPRHFADLTGDSGDAITADLFLQCILFGKEVYA